MVSTFYQSGLMNVTCSHDLQMACLLDGVRNGNINVVTTLLSLFNLDVDDNSHYEAYYATPLMVAVEANQSDMVELLLSLDSDPNKTDYYNRTALYYAIYNQCDIKIIKKLLQAGANIYARPLSYEETENTPMMLAEKMGNKEVIEVLIPYTRGHKRWRQIRLIMKFFSVIKDLYDQSVHNVWRPKGKGYDVVRDEFYMLAKYENIDGLVV